MKNIFGLMALAGMFTADHGYSYDGVKKTVKPSYTSSRSELKRFYYSLSEMEKSAIKESPNERIKHEPAEEYLMRMTIKRAIRP